MEGIAARQHPCICHRIEQGRKTSGKMGKWDIPDHCNISEANLQKKRTAITISKLVTMTGNSGLFGLPVREQHTMASKLPSLGGARGCVWLELVFYCVIYFCWCVQLQLPCPLLGSTDAEDSWLTIESGNLLLA